MTTTSQANKVACCTNWHIWTTTKQAAFICQWAHRGWSNTVCKQYWRHVAVQMRPCCALRVWTYCVRISYDAWFLQLYNCVCRTCLGSLCKHYFYLIRETFDDMEAILIRNLSINCSCDGQGDQHDEVLATLKLFEELSRCMATRALRTLSVDLNRCVKLWSNILNNSHLIGKYLVDERNYLLSSQACDVLASIGMDIFENLLINKRYLIITCLLNLTKSDSSNLVRSASIRALGKWWVFAMLLIFATA